MDLSAKRFNSRAQVTLFIFLAMIVAVAIVAYFNLSGNISSNDKNSSFVSNYPPLPNNKVCTACCSVCDQVKNSKNSETSAGSGTSTDSKNANEYRYYPPVDLGDIGDYPPGTYDFAPERKASSGNWIVDDVESHFDDTSKLTFLNDPDIRVRAHEHIHHLNFESSYGDDITQSLYLLNSKMIDLYTVSMDRFVTSSYVPPSLQGSSFDTYISRRSTAGDPENVLYPFDEWVAYYSGDLAAFQNRDWDVVYSNLIFFREMEVYALCTGMALKDKYPQYWESEDGIKTRKFMQWQLDRSQKFFNLVAKELGGDYETSTAYEYAQTVKTSPDADNLRRFSLAEFKYDWATVT